MEIRTRCAHCGKSFAFLPEAEARAVLPSGGGASDRVVYRPQCPYCRGASDVPRPAPASGAGDRCCEACRSRHS